jgi:hypothetical protein
MTTNVSLPALELDLGLHQRDLRALSDVIGDVREVAVEAPSGHYGASQL